MTTRRPLVERFWKRAAIGLDSECWPWLGPRRGGAVKYGGVWDGFKGQAAHRVAWTLEFGSIPDGSCVLHRCDNGLCVNPGHLFLGSIADNNRDKAAKGRASRIMGSSQRHSKLTDARVLQLRAEYAEGRSTMRDLAIEYDISNPLVSYIVNRQRWQHI